MSRPHPLRDHDQKSSISPVYEAFRYTKADGTTTNEAVIRRDNSIIGKQSVGISLVDEAFQCTKVDGATSSESLVW